MSDRKPPPDDVRQRAAAIDALQPGDAVARFYLVRRSFLEPSVETIARHTVSRVTARRAILDDGTAFTRGYLRANGAAAPGHEGRIEPWTEEHDARLAAEEEERQRREALRKVSREHAALRSRIEGLLRDASSETLRRVESILCGKEAA